MTAEQTLNESVLKIVDALNDADVESLIDWLTVINTRGDRKRLHYLIKSIALRLAAKVMEPGFLE